MRDNKHYFEVLRLREAHGSTFRDIRREAIEGHPDAFGTSLSEELIHDDAWYLDKLEADHVFGGFNQSGMLTGTVALAKRGVGTRRTAALSGMYVSPAASGTGLSRLLLDAALSEALRDGHSVVLAVTVTNEAAIRLYLSAGFREWKDFKPTSRLDEISPRQILMRLDRYRVHTATRPMQLQPKS
jgi:ribosomal protein S18 acetylase RimI-like enzyme